MEYDVSSLKAFYRDYTHRTRYNYEVIKKQPKMSRYDVTQLINSLFGFVMMPFETIVTLDQNRNSILAMQKNEKRMDDANHSAYISLHELIIKLRKEHRYYDDYSDDWKNGVEVYSFVRRIRNSLAHSGGEGLRFYPIGENKEIEGIMFADEDKEHDKAFIVELTIGELVSISECLELIFSNFEEKSFISSQKYKGELQSYKKKICAGGYYTIVFPKNNSLRREIEGKFKNDLKFEKNDNGVFSATFFVNEKRELENWCKEHQNSIIDCITEYDI